MKNKNSNETHPEEASLLENRREFLRILSGGAVLVGVGSVVARGGSPPPPPGRAGPPSLPGGVRSSEREPVRGIEIALVRLRAQAGSRGLRSRRARRRRLCGRRCL